MLNPKQQRFVEEYLIDLNATQAAIRAGYSEKTAGEQAARLLKNVIIKHAIQSKQLEIQSRTQVTADFVIGGFVEVANRCMQKVPVMEFDPTTKRKRQKKTEDGEGVWEFDSSGANKALEMLGKHLGVFERDNGQKKPDQVQMFTDQQFDKLVSLLNGKK